MQIMKPKWVRRELIRVYDVYLAIVGSRSQHRPPQDVVIVATGIVVAQAAMTKEQVSARLVCVGGGG